MGLVEVVLVDSVQVEIKAAVHLYFVGKLAEG